MGAGATVGGATLDGVGCDREDDGAMVDGVGGGRIAVAGVATVGNASPPRLVVTASSLGRLIMRTVGSSTALSNGKRSPFFSTRHSSSANSELICCSRQICLTESSV